MTIHAISANSVVANPEHINTQAKVDQSASLVNAQHQVKKIKKAHATDTVTISQNALQKTQKLANDGDTAAVEAKETAAKKAGETAKGTS